MDRRTVLRGACLGCAGLALAACGGASSGGGSASTSGGSTPAPAKTGPLALLADLKVGDAVAAKTPDGRGVLLTRVSQTEVVAFSSICTHQGCTVEPAGAQLACPCHGSVYDGKTGQVLSGPAPSPLPAIAVTVRDGGVFLA